MSKSAFEILKDKGWHFRVIPAHFSGFMGLASFGHEPDLDEGGYFYEWGYTRSEALEFIVFVTAKKLEII